jgi:hypothetical protein
MNDIEGILTFTAPIPSLSPSMPACGRARLCAQSLRAGFRDLVPRSLASTRRSRRNTARVCTTSTGTSASWRLEQRAMSQTASYSCSNWRVGAGRCIATSLRRLLRQGRSSRIEFRSVSGSLTSRMDGGCHISPSGPLLGCSYPRQACQPGLPGS